MARRPETQSTPASTPVFNIPPAHLAAPIITFEAVPAFGLRDGIATIALEALVDTQDSRGHAVTERVLVGHLKMGPRAAGALRAALEKIALMGTPTGTAQ